MIGINIGSYRVEEKLGAGGMGEVYRARDTKLNRDVALKLLPEAFASDPDRVMRFTREAQTLASLNHPNIAAIYGIEDRALVMELVKGDDLSARIARGPMPIEDIFPIARQIAEALEAAHEAGIIHRDLKPANIKVKADGMVKVLDFGLAKALGQGAPSATADSTEDSALTVTSPALTQMGVILGTAAYMSPEQARGRPVDRRSDIWAFGVVLFEMLTGRRLFDGPTMGDTLAAVLRADVDLTTLPAGTPPTIRRLLTRCLDRDPKTRLRDIGEARIALTHTNVDEDSGAPSADAPRRGPRWLLWAAGLVVVAASATVTWMMAPEVGPPDRVRRLTIQLPADPTFANGDYRIVAISPDGQYVAAVLQRHLYVRRIDQTTATRIEGTEGARSPFFSPDSLKIGFWADDQIKWTTVGGAPPVSVGTVTLLTDASWGADGFIYASSWRFDIVRLPQAGGTPEVVVQVDGQKVYGPQLLPGGEWLMFSQVPTADNYDEARVMAQSLTSDQLVELEQGMEGRATSHGHLLYVRNNVLFSRRFDARRLEVSGDPVPVVDGVRTTGRRFSGAAQYDVAHDGTLVYLPGGGGQDATSLAWVDRTGRQVARLPVEALQLSIIGLVLSPDQTKIAAHRADLNEIWLFDVDRSAGRQLTRPGTNYPVWSHDSAWVYFGGSGGIWKRRADLSGAPEAVELGPEVKPGFYFPSSASRDGEYLYVNYSPEGTQLGFGRLSLRGGAPRFEMLVEPEPDRIGGFASPSPDDRFVAYAGGPPFNIELWMMEVATRRKTRVSDGTGENARWTTPDEIVFMDGGDVMSATVRTEPTLAVSSLRLLHRRSTYSAFDVTRDGLRFLHTVPASGGGDGAFSPGPVNVSVVLNVFEDVRRLVAPRPTGGR
jgi:serine/threonine-protein kinase